ncbi:MAG: hypothetical protein R2813_02345 [Flavobacteriales bacterium]
MLTFRNFIISWIILASPSLVEAQVKNVNPAVKFIDGDIYYLHTVLKGQTIDAIASAYYSNSKDIRFANPGIEEPLKPDLRIRIPYTDASLEALSSNAPVDRQYTEPLDQTWESAPPTEQAEEPMGLVMENQTPLEEAISLNESDPVESTSTEPPSTEKVQVEIAEPEPTAVAPVLEPEIGPPTQILYSEPDEPITEAPIDSTEAVFDQPTAIEEVIAMMDEDIEEPIQDTAQQIAAESDTLITSQAELLIVREKTSNGTTANADSVSNEELSEGSKKALNDLAELSKSINESLASLEKIKEALGEPSKTVQPVSEYLDEVVMAYFDTTGSTSLEIKEFFFVSLSQEGRFTRVQDERTTTNHNSTLLDPDSLKFVKLDAFNGHVNPNEIIALGIERSVHHYTYEVKSKKKKTKITPKGTEKSANPEDHFDAVTSHVNGKLGTFLVRLEETITEVSTYEPFEYNPFGSKDKVLLYIEDVNVNDAQ